LFLLAVQGENEGGGIVAHLHVWRFFLLALGPTVGLALGHRKRQNLDEAKIRDSCFPTMAQCVASFVSLPLKMT
jgi:hypothetical protein